MTNSNVALSRQSDLLADAIIRFLHWQSRQLDIKKERKVKAMITRQRNLCLRQNRKPGLSDQ